MNEYQRDFEREREIREDEEYHDLDRETEEQRDLRILRNIADEASNQINKLTVLDFLGVMNSLTEYDYREIIWDIREGNSADLGKFLLEKVKDYCRRVAAMEVEKRN